jgi:hypothetical protein
VALSCNPATGVQSNGFRGAVASVICGGAGTF